MNITLNRLTFITLVALTLSACAPNFQKWTPQQVIDSFKSAGLEAENTSVLAPGDYGLAPLVAQEGVRFLIPALGPDSGGRVFSFETQENLDQMQAYYVKLGEESAILFSWVFVRDNILVQINGQLPQETARKYESALNGLK